MKVSDQSPGERQQQVEPEPGELDVAARRKWHQHPIWGVWYSAWQSKRPLQAQLVPVESTVSRSSIGSDPCDS
jgi:hypothetical protein